MHDDVKEICIYKNNRFHLSLTWRTPRMVLLWLLVITVEKLMFGKVKDSHNIIHYIIYKKISL